MKYKIMIIEKQKEVDNKISYLARLKNDKFILNIYTKHMYNSKKNFDKGKIREVTNYAYGDYIAVSGKIVVPETLGNIGEFDYKKYLNSKDICGLVNAYEVEHVDNIGYKCIKTVYCLKQKIADSIDNNLENREAELLKSMLYGDIRNLDENIKNSFNEIGISHITAVSGSNLNVLLLILSFLLYKIKNKRKIYILIQIVFIILFCIISGLELSIVRASIMSVIGIICKYRNIKLSIEKILLFTIYIITVVNPFRIFNIGMIFSFLSVIGVVYFSPKISNYLESKIKWNIKSKAVVKILCFLSNVLSITLAVNILVLPFNIFVFNKVSLIFVLSNIFVSIISTGVNVLGIISICLSKIPVISNINYSILELMLKLIIHLSDFFNNINFCIYIKTFSPIILIIYYLYILITCINIRNNKKYLRRFLQYIKTKLAFVFALSMILTVIYNSFFNNYIYFFNVGQGEMSVIKNNDTVIMIDSGSITNDTAYIFESYMKKEGIRNLDALVISHFHSDHINGILEIIEMCEVKYLIYAYPYDEKSEEYITFMDKIEKQNIKKIIVKSGDNIKIGDIKLNVLFPKNDYITVSGNIEENENANSLVINANIKNKNYLFMGDSLKESEEYILEELKIQRISDVEIIKIGHHGSKTSTSEEFIQFVLPKYGIISANKRVYNHPSIQTTEVLEKYSVLTYITEKVGGIKYII